MSWETFWKVWTGVVAATFAVAEAVALLRPGEDTLSEAVLWPLSRRPSGRACMGAVLGWLAYHVLVDEGQRAGWPDDVTAFIAGGLFASLPIRHADFATQHATRNTQTALRSKATRSRNQSRLPGPG